MGEKTSLLFLSLNLTVTLGTGIGGRDEFGHGVVCGWPSVPDDASICVDSEADAGSSDESGLADVDGPSASVVGLGDLEHAVASSTSTAITSTKPVPTRLRYDIRTSMTQSIVDLDERVSTPSIRDRSWTNLAENLIRQVRADRTALGW